MGASIGMAGTARAQYHLRQSFVFLTCFALNQPEVMVTFAQDKIDKDGNVTDVKTREKIRELLEKNFKTDGMTVSVNTSDEKDSIYLTVTGTSWENGDDGQVGRGNRSNGLITPCRPMSLEAVAGKNPISHVGKIYNLKAQEIANKLHEVFNVREVQVELLSKIGTPISEPFVGVKYISNGDFIEKEAEQIVFESLSREGFEDLIQKLLKGSISVF